MVILGGRGRREIHAAAAAQYVGGGGQVSGAFGDHRGRQVGGDRMPSDPHHLRFTQSRALGRKVSDEFTVPLCRSHHREVHRYRDEAAWWRTAGLDPSTAARTLWLETHPMAQVPIKLPVNVVEPLAARRSR